MIQPPPGEGLLEFPCDYIFKAFGPAEPRDSFRDRVLEAVNDILPVGLDALKVRPSSGGHYVCVSIVVRVHNREQVDAVYRSLGKLDGLRYLL